MEITYLCHSMIDLIFDLCLSAIFNLDSTQILYMQEHMDSNLNVMFTRKVFNLL